MRKIDADHLRIRAIDGECDNVIDLIDTEPTVVDGEDENSIFWIPSKRERRTKNCHAITNGVECSRCRCFEEYQRRFCPDCGGKYNGELPIKNKYAERKFRGTKQWHV